MTTAAFSAAIRRAIPESSLTVSAWADTYRYLAPERSALPGRWKTDVVPYARGIMDAVSRPDVREVVFMKSSQVAGSEIANNIIGYYIHIEPSPILYVAENESKAKAWSQESLAPMIRDTPVLAALVEDARSRDSGNTIEGKKFPGGHLAVAWATSAATLSSRPRRIVIFDEVDGFGTTAEGDPISLGEARTKTFPDAKLIRISSPRDKATSRIEPAYNTSYAGKFFVPCPHCEAFQTIDWDRIRWDEHPLEAYLICQHCGCLIEHDQKSNMLARGEWRFGTVVEERDSTGKLTAAHWQPGGQFHGAIGFYIWEGYSPFVSWGQMAANFLKKKKRVDELRAFVNTSLAQTWEERDTEIEIADLPARCEDYDAEVPEGVLLLTCGVDVQGDRLEYEVVGWGVDDESWSICYGQLPGDPAQSDVWNELHDLVLRRGWQSTANRYFFILCTCVDSGGHHTDEVYKFARQNLGRKVFAIKGANTPGKPLISKPTLQGKPPVKLFTIGTETAKDSFSARLKVLEPGPNYCHFPVLIDEAGNPVYGETYFKQLCSEQPVVTYVRGARQRVWRKLKPSLRNEALDCRVYAMAALAILNPNWQRLADGQARDLATIQPEESVMPRQPAPPRPSRGRSGGGGFINNW